MDRRSCPGADCTPPASAELLMALDRRLQEGVFEEGSLPALSQLMSVGDVELRSDLQYERFRTPRPKDTWQIFGEGTPAGLQRAKTFGPSVAETPKVPMTDEIALAETGNEQDPPAVAVFGVMTQSRSCGRRPRVRRCWLPVTAKVWWMPRQPGCSPTAESCSTPGR